MSASTPTTNTSIFRSKSFWLLSLFVLYSIFGWIFIPKIVESQLKVNLKTLANWDTRIDSVVFNPYALSLSLSDTHIHESTDQPVLSFDELFINFSLLGSLTGTIAFDEISLSKPVINLDVDQHGTTNFQRAFTSDSAEAAPEPSDESGDMLALVFELITVSSGKVHLSDDSQGENFTLDLEPISLSLEGFSTHTNEGGDYALSISLDEQQEIKWRGQIGIAPFQSKGHLELHKIASDTFWHYVKTHSPYWLNSATISLTGDYNTAIQPDVTQFNIENTELLIEDIALSENEASTPLLALNSLKVAPIAFDLSELALELGHIELDQLELAVERANDASLNLLRPLISKTPDDVETPKEKAPAATQEPVSTDSEFKWQIDDIRLTQSKVSWKDLAVSNPIELSLKDIELNIGTLSDDLSQAFAYDLSFDYSQSSEQLAQSETRKKQHISGHLSPQPFSLKGKADISNIELATLQNYLDEATNIAIKKGRVSLSSDYALAMTETLTGKVISTLSIDDLALSDRILDKPLSGFKQLSLGPVIVDLPKDDAGLLSVDIESIVLDEPFGEVFIAEDGKINLAHLTKTAETPSEQTADIKPTSDEQTQEPAAAFALLLKLFELKNGQFSYTDASLKPAFTTRISDLSGTIEGISSDLEAKSKVAFTGNIDSQGSLKVNGTLNPLSQKPYTDLKVLINNVNLSMASPYSAKYAGYLIDKGKLDLDLNYQITDTRLEAKNQILLNQFKFGKSVDSKDATSLPLPLAIGILKDRNDKINIDLPISGDLNDPSFKITSVIFNTFVNLITKVVTSPFSILGGLIEGGDDISEVEFAANSSAISDQQRERIILLAKALKERPNLTLEIRGMADANRDQLDNTSRSEHELIALAKDRANQMSNAIIEQGNIDAARVFILEPEIIPLSPPTIDEKQSEPPANTALTIPSKFTLGVR